jgi:hypothetical protein
VPEVPLGAILKLFHTYIARGSDFLEKNDNLIRLGKKIRFSHASWEEGWRLAEQGASAAWVEMTCDSPVGP